jgi:hypothetical protein
MPRTGVEEKRVSIMVQKASSKKKVKKSSSTRKAAKPDSRAVAARMRVYNLTREVPQEKYFILANGQPVKNVAELAAILDQLEDHVFHHHVSANRNDFQNWVKDVFEDLELAKKIVGSKDKKHLQLVIYRHIAGHD